jgi:hypothetical protein
MVVRAKAEPLDLTAFDEVAEHQYEWQIANDGEIAGLVAGDQGYDFTGVTLQELVGAALYAVADEGWETQQWPLHNELQEALAALVKTSRKVIGARPAAVAAAADAMEADTKKPVQDRPEPAE